MSSLLTANTKDVDCGVSASIDNISIINLTSCPGPPALPKALSKETMRALT